MELGEFPGVDWLKMSESGFNQVFEPGGGIEVSAQWITRSLAEQQHRIAQIVEEVQTQRGTTAHPGSAEGSSCRTRSTEAGLARKPGSAASSG